MDFTEILKDLGESLADYRVAVNLKEIGLTLEKLGNDTDDPARSYAYKIAATEVLEKALERMKKAKAKIPLSQGRKDEAE